MSLENINHVEAKLEEEEQEFFLEKVALLDNVAGARRALYEEFPDAEKVSIKSMRSYVNRSEVQDRLTSHREWIAKQAKERPLTQDFGRITVLCDVLNRMLNRLYADGSTMSVRDLATLSGEIRSNLRELRQEMSPFDLGAFEEFSPILALQATYQKATQENPALAKFLQMDGPPDA